jgi:hypothetical protein
VLVIVRLVFFTALHGIVLQFNQIRVRE